MRIGRFGVRNQGGYSLTEMLVVVAMIGMFSLVTVPQFINLYRQAKIRAAVRQFNSHLRQTRQRAITQNKQTAVSFAPGLNPAGGHTSGQYALYEIDTSTDPDSWDQVGAWYRLEEPVYFLASNFATDSTIDDTLHDVIFNADGTVSNLPSTAKIEFKTDADVPNNHCTVTMHAAGSFTSAMSTD